MRLIITLSLIIFVIIYTSLGRHLKNIYMNRLNLNIRISEYLSLLL